MEPEEIVFWAEEAIKLHNKVHEHKEPKKKNGK
jgi:hypothetical protein